MYSQSVNSVLTKKVANQKKGQDKPLFSIENFLSYIRQQSAFLFTPTIKHIISEVLCNILCLMVYKQEGKTLDDAVVYGVEVKRLEPVILELPVQLRILFFNLILESETSIFVCILTWKCSSVFPVTLLKIFQLN